MRIYAWWRFLLDPSEYIAATELSREISWIENLFLDLKLELIKPIELFGDNENANGIGNGITVNNRTRHIAL